MNTVFYKQKSVENCEQLKQLKRFNISIFDN